MILKIYSAKSNVPLTHDEACFLKQFADAEKSISNIKQNADNTLIGICLTTKAVHDAFEIPLKDIHVKYKENGKPYISGRDDIFISISHSDNFIVCAVSDSPVGIDTEKIRQYNPKLANKYFTEEDIAYISNSDKAFTEIWTKKEAALKISGEGIKGIKNPELFKGVEYETIIFEDYVISWAIK